MVNRQAAIRFLMLICMVLSVCPSGISQGTPADYLRADSYRTELAKLVYHADVRPAWIGESHKFWYRTRTMEGVRFFIVDADRKTKKPVFDHDKMAERLAALSGEEVKAEELPFQIIRFSENEQEVSFTAFKFQWTYYLKSKQLKKGDKEEDSDRTRRSEEVKSPDEKWLAFVKGFNLFIRSTETAEEFQLSRDGTEENYYDRIVWSPDSKKIALFQIKHGQESRVHLIESSPKDQLQAKHRSRTYQLPENFWAHGNRVDRRRYIR